MLSILESEAGLDLNSSGDDSWFAGKMPRGKAEKILEGLPDGTFLVRESDSRLVCQIAHTLKCQVNSATNQGDYSLSIKYQIVKHIKVNQTGTRYDIAPDAKNFGTIQARPKRFHRSVF